MLSIQAWAQQLPLLSQFQESAGVLNPAAVPGLYLQFEHDLQIVGTFHSQWTGFEGNPRTTQLAANVLFSDYEGVVPMAGLYVINDQIGPTGFTGAYAKLAGVISGDTYEGGLSFGLQAGFNQYKLNISELKLRDEEMVFAANNDSRVKPDVGIGVFAYKRFDNQLFYAGVSAPQVLGLNLSYNSDQGNLVSQRYRHYYAQLGAQFSLRDDQFIEPVAWLKYVPNVPLHLNTTVRYQSASALFVGVGGSSSGSAHGEIGVLLGDRSAQLFRIGYGFDYAFRNYGSYAGGTHELNLSYSISR